MTLSFWQLFGVKVLLGAIVAFGLAWFTQSKSRASLRGLFGSLFVVITPGCAPMFQSDPIASNRAAEEFFWTLIPLLAAWLVSAAIAIALARISRWKE